MRCAYCRELIPETGYCCERLELETLRAVVDEVTAHLDSEVVATKSIGALDVVEPVVHAAARLKQARSRAA